jgi:hypothetical protein
MTIYLLLANEYKLPILTKKIKKLKRGITLKYNFENNASCLTTAPYYDMPHFMIIPVFKCLINNKISAQQQQR